MDCYDSSQEEKELNLLFNKVWARGGISVAYLADLCPQAFRGPNRWSAVADRYFHDLPKLAQDRYAWPWKHGSDQDIQVLCFEALCRTQGALHDKMAVGGWMLSHMLETPPRSVGKVLKWTLVF